MPKKSFRRCFSILPAILVFNFLWMLPAFAQQNNKAEGRAALYAKFIELSKLPCGQRGEAVKVGKQLIERFANDDFYKAGNEAIRQQIEVFEKQDEACKNPSSLESLFNKFKTLRKEPCGKRDEAVRVGKRILELYSNDPDNPDVINFVKADTAKMEKEDKSCKVPPIESLTKKQKRVRLITQGKEIIAQEGNSPLALDVMLSMVSSGYDLAVNFNDDTFNSDTMTYAKLAIQRIESGQTSQTGNWGVFADFKSKENALARLNYIAGYVSYFRLKEPKKAISYFYQATRYNAEFKFDGFVYHAVAIHYFEKESVTPSSLTINEFITRATSLGETDNPNFSPEENARNREVGMLYKQLVNLYNLRYNLQPEENVIGLTDYILKLINRPLVNTANSRVTTVKMLM